MHLSSKNKKLLNLQKVCNMQLHEAQTLSCTLEFSTENTNIEFIYANVNTEKRERRYVPVFHVHQQYHLILSYYASKL